MNELSERLGKVHINLPKELVRVDKKGPRRLPESYKRNTKKEQLVLAYAENFRRQFVQLYRDRKPLYLAPKNECNVEKFVSTTIRPTQLPYKELYDIDGCAEFVADYLSYELLDNPTELPQKMRSPCSVLHEQQGNCFEYSTLLCSLLIGNGYDAYCVSGYASHEVCVMDESRDVCPFLEEKNMEVVTAETKKRRKYTVKPPKDMNSKFIRKMEAQRVTEEAEMTQRLKDEEEARQDELVKPKLDKFYGLRIHSWVLVLHGKREVAESFFIEPSTGRAHSLQYDGYLGIESVWSNENYWVNMQDCADGVKSMVYDLGDAAQWEYIFPLLAKPVLMLPEDELAADEFEEEADIAVDKDVLDMPPSWVEKLVLSQRDLQSRCPQGKKTILYKRAKLEKLAEYLRHDGLVCCLTVYKDYQQKDVIEIRQWFKHRVDKLISRELNKTTNTVVEQFAPGRPRFLKENKYCTDSQGGPLDTRTMTFYSKVRVDGLVKRVETPTELSEHYLNRSDFLYYFNAEFGIKTPSTNSQRPILKMTERYHRNPDKPASEDIAERVFYVTEDKYQLTYHLEDDKITANTRDMNKPAAVCTPKEGVVVTLTADMTRAYRVDPNARDPKRLQLFNLMTELIAAEEQRTDYVRSVEREVADILKARGKEEQATELTVSIYDTARNDTAKTRRLEMERKQLEEEEARKEMQLDYLAPFLAQIGDPEKLSAVQAAEVRESCLRDLKQRLIDMANVIQSRFEKETQELQRQQAWYQQNQTTLNKEQEEDYLTFCSKAMFRIHILEERLNRHKTVAPEKYKAMERKLAGDSRLRAE